MDIKLSRPTFGAKAIIKINVIGSGRTFGILETQDVNALQREVGRVMKAKRCTKEESI